MDINKIKSGVKDALRLFSVIGCLVLVSGCEALNKLEPGKKKPEDVLGNYQCTKDQLELVKTEFLICNESDYYSSHCFLQAKKSQCTYTGDKAQDGR